MIQKPPRVGLLPEHWPEWIKIAVAIIVGVVILLLLIWRDS